MRSANETPKRRVAKFPLHLFAMVYNMVLYIICSKTWIFLMLCSPGFIHYKVLKAEHSSVAPLGD